MRLGFRRSMGRALGALALLTACAFVSGGAEAARAEKTSGLTLDDVSFLCGAWRHADDDAMHEEHWLLPEGNSMIGVYRWVSVDTLRMAEFMMMEQDDAGVTLRMKHYSSGWREWEDREPITLRLARAEENLAEFVNDKHDKPKRITYRRDGDRLTATIDTTREGQAHTFDVEMEFVGPAR